MRHPVDSFYIPMLFWIAATLVGVAQPALGISISHGVAILLNLAAFLLLVVGAIFGYRATRSRNDGHGGRGGEAVTTGDDSRATGGEGGAANGGNGGDGGNAIAHGKRSIAKGGKGGTG